MVSLIEKYQDKELNARYSEMGELKRLTREEKGDSDTMNTKLMRKINTLFIKGNTDKHKKIILASGLVTDPEVKKKLDDVYLQITSTGIGRSRYKDSQINMFSNYKDSHIGDSFSDMVLATPELYNATLAELKPLNKMILTEMKEINDKYPNLKEIKTISVKENLNNPEKFLKETYGDNDGNVRIEISSSDSFSVSIGSNYGYSGGIDISFDSDGKDKLYSMMVLENHFDQVRSLYAKIRKEQTSLLSEWNTFIKEIDYALAKYVVFNKI